MRNKNRLASRAGRGIIPPMSERFTIRPAASGFSVYDVWTGEVAVIAMTPQKGLSREDAEHTAEVLNRRAERDDRQMVQ
jgi:hypothetical protein